MADDAAESALVSQVEHLRRALAWERIQKERLLDALDLVQRENRRLRASALGPCASAPDVECLRQENRLLRQRGAELEHTIAELRQPSSCA